MFPNPFTHVHSLEKDRVILVLRLFFSALFSRILSYYDLFLINLINLAFPERNPMFFAKPVHKCSKTELFSSGGFFSALFSQVFHKVFCARLSTKSHSFWLFQDVFQFFLQNKSKFPNPFTNVQRLSYFSLEAFFLCPFFTSFSESILRSSPAPKSVSVITWR